MWDTNPNLIEEPEPGSTAARAIPVVLMHDGGGTVFSYYCLGRLGRPMYGVFNPKFRNGGSWAAEGGIPAMARYYVGLVRAAVPRGPVILGGWSLGGLLALEMARVLADAGDGHFRVAGLVMIDSVCVSAPPPDRPPKQEEEEDDDDDDAATTTTTTTMDQPAAVVRPVAPRHLFGERTRQETRDAVLRCFADSSSMVGAWAPPAWGSRAPPPPPAILLRAREGVPVDDGDHEGAGAGVVARVDLHRDDPRLGWDSYRADLFCRVVEVPGHHFNMFSEDNVADVTAAIRTACDTLERMFYPGGRRDRPR